MFDLDGAVRCFNEHAAPCTALSLGGGRRKGEGGRALRGWERNGSAEARVLQRVGEGCGEHDRGPTTALSLRQMVLSLALLL